MSSAQGSSTTHPTTTRPEFSGHSAAPHCGPGHELQPFKREHDTNPSSSANAV
ncbi:hypothetical protein B0H19DRAFT_1377175 [Mycena capillaripes]|nr:hypothetical protein B0H19DRAFT_1377175 [Mycena capillaripes]